MPVYVGDDDLALLDALDNKPRTGASAAHVAHNNKHACMGLCFTLCACHR